MATPGPGPRSSRRAAADTPRWAAGVCDGAYAAGVRDVVYVPDNPLSHVLERFADRHRDVRLVLATREEEAFGVAAGLYLGGDRPIVLCQSSGLANSLNAITSLLVPYQIPVLAVISMRGDVGEWNAAQVPFGRGLPAVLDAIGVAHCRVESADSAAGLVRLAAETAFATRLPGACLLARRVTTER